jgi:hypothetical protein
MTISLAFLAPSLVKAAVDGRRHSNLSLFASRNSAAFKISALWTRSRASTVTSSLAPFAGTSRNSRRHASPGARLVSVANCKIVRQNRHFRRSSAANFACRDAAQFQRLGKPPEQPREANQAPRNTDNDIWAADIHLTPNGRFLYASERTTSTIAAFRVDSATGKLSYLGGVPTEKQPRGFNIDPTGRFIVVSGEKSDMLGVYSIDGESGTLKVVGRYPTGNGANWVEIVSFD